MCRKYGVHRFLAGLPAHALPTIRLLLTGRISLPDAGPASSRHFGEVVDRNRLFYCFPRNSSVREGTDHSVKPEKTKLGKLEMQLLAYAQFRETDLLASGQVLRPWRLPPEQEWKRLLKPNHADSLDTGTAGQRQHQQSMRTYRQWCRSVNIELKSTKTRQFSGRRCCSLPAGPG